MNTIKYNNQEKYDLPIYPYTGGYILNSGSKVCSHGHDFYEILIINKGKCIQTINNVEVLLLCNTIQFLTPGDIHSLHVSNLNEICEVTNIAFTKYNFRKIISFMKIELINFKEYKKPILLSKTNIRNISSELTGILDNLYNLDREEVEMNFKSLIVNIIVTMVKTQRQKNIYNAPPWIVNACNEMKYKSNYTEGLNIFVQLSGRTREHLTRELKKYYKVTPTEYINNLRLKEAKELLISTDMKIINIIFECGFNNVSHFISCFKGRYMVSPKKYRDLYNLNFKQ